MSIKGENFLGGNMSHLLQALIKRLEGDIEVAKANVMVYTRNAAGIGGEGNADVLEEIEKELDIVARYHDQLEMLDKYFVDEAAPRNLFEEQQNLFEEID